MNSLRSDRSPLTCAWQCLRLRTCAYAGGLRGRVLRYGDGYVLEVLIYIDAVMSYIPIRTERTSHYDWTSVPLRLILVEHQVDYHTRSYILQFTSI